MTVQMLPHTLNVLIAGRTTAASREEIIKACQDAGMNVHRDMTDEVDIVFSVDGDQRNGYVRIAKERIQQGSAMLIQTLADLTCATADPEDYLRRLGKVYVRARTRSAPVRPAAPPPPPALFMTAAIIPKRQFLFSMSL